MVTADELEGFRRDRYFARSWAMLTRDRGWIKPLLLMTVAMLVPIVGLLGVMGYMFEWARLTAWGVNSAPKQKGVRVGECIASGWRVFVVAFGWGLCWGIVSAVLSIVPLIGGLLSFVCLIFGFFFTVVATVAALRATIYQKLGAGFKFSTIWQMCSHDASGLLRIMGISLLGGVIMGIVAFVVMFSALMSILPQMLYLISMYDSYYFYMSDAEQAQIAFQILNSLLSMLPTLLVLYLLEAFAAMFLGMIGCTAVGLWMRQFNVPAWGRSEDPLPPFVNDPRDYQWGGPVSPGAGAVPGAPAGAAPAAGAWQQPVAPTQAPSVAAPVSAPAPSASPVPRQVDTQAPAATTPAVPAPVEPIIGTPQPAAPAQASPIPMPAAAPEVVAAAEPAAAPEAPVESTPAEPIVPEPASEPAATDEVVEVTPIAVAPVSAPSEPLPDLTPEDNGSEPSDQQ